MGEQQRKRGFGFWLAVAMTAIVPCAAYFGAYALVVEASPVAVETSPGIVTPYVVALYRWPGSSNIGSSEFGRLIFIPANELDRRLRPGKWTIKP